jgi:predicted nucleic acid-binding protein
MRIAMRRSSRRPDANASDRPVRYIETSALLVAVVDREPEAIEQLRADGQRVTSALTFAEAARAIVRGRVTDQLTEGQARAAARALRTFERRCLVIAVTDEVLARVRRPFPIEPIRTLDAIHLATAELVGEPPALMTIVTRDRRVEQNARALGYSVA